MHKKELSKTEERVGELVIATAQREDREDSKCLVCRQRLGRGSDLKHMKELQVPGHQWLTGH